MKGERKVTVTKDEIWKRIEDLQDRIESAACSSDCATIDSLGPKCDRLYYLLKMIEEGDSNKKMSKKEREESQLKNYKEKEKAKIKSYNEKYENDPDCFEKSGYSEICDNCPGDIFIRCFWQTPLD